VKRWHGLLVDMVVDRRELDGGMHVWAAEGFVVGHLILCKTGVSASRYGR